MYFYIYVDTYMYIYTCIYMIYIYMYTYAYIQRFAPRRVALGAARFPNVDRCLFCIYMYIYHMYKRIHMALYWVNSINIYVYTHIYVFIIY